MVCKFDRSVEVDDVESGAVVAKNGRIGSIREDTDKSLNEKKFLYDVVYKHELGSSALEFDGEGIAFDQYHFFKTVCLEEVGVYTFVKWRYPVEDTVEDIIDRLVSKNYLFFLDDEVLAFTFLGQVLLDDYIKEIENGSLF